MALIEKADVDFAFPVTTFPFPIQRAIRMNSDSRVEMFSPEHLNTRSQDLDEAYHDVGQFYCGKPLAYMSNKPIFSNCSAGILLPRKEAQDIDTPEDWEAAEIAFEVLSKA